MIQPASSLCPGGFANRLLLKNGADLRKLPFPFRHHCKNAEIHRQRILPAPPPAGAFAHCVA